MRHKTLILSAFVFMIGLTGCGNEDIKNISNEKNEKIHDDIPADEIRNVNISGNARSVVIKQGTTDNFEFYNADLEEDHQYEVETAYDEDGNDLNILVTMENADTGNDVLGSVVVSIPEKEFEKIETTGEFKQIYLETLNSDVLIHTDNATVTMELTADRLDHNITLDGSESASFRDAIIYFDKLPENVKMEFTNVPSNAIDDSDGLLTGGQLESGSGNPVISINHADKVELYMDSD